MTRRSGEPPHHNTLTCYTDYGCRQPECVDRRRQWQRDLRRKKREGQPPLVDARPVRDHILALQAVGASTYRISLISGVNDWTVRAFLPSAGRRARKNSTTPDIARKILAVTVETMASGYIDSTGTRRRIQALATNGWPLRIMAEPLGLHPHYVGDLLGRRAGHPVFASTAEKVARGYDRIKTQKPPRKGVDPRAVKRIRKKAAEERWPTPAYWDQHPGAIDDPHFEPLYGVTRRELIAQDANWIMRTTGADRATAAARLGVSKAYVEHAFRDHPEYALEVAA